MWYTANYDISDYSALGFLRDVLGLFADTLAELMRVPIFSAFLAFSALAVVFALVLYILYVSKQGVK